MANGLKVKNVAKVLIPLLLAISILGNGMTARNAGMGYLNLLQEQDFKVNLMLTGQMGMELLYFRITRNTKVDGKMG